jgi:hypothetical protein
VQEGAADRKDATASSSTASATSAAEGVVELGPEWAEFVKLEEALKRVLAVAAASRRRSVSLGRRTSGTSGSAPDVGMDAVRQDLDTRADAAAADAVRDIHEILSDTTTKFAMNSSPSQRNLVARDGGDSGGGDNVFSASPLSRAQRQLQTTSTLVSGTATAPPAAAADATTDARGTSEAVRWYLAAADRGLAAAQFSLGFMYEDGRGVDQSPEDAAKWYRKAADQGYAAAQFSLSAMYREGRGVPQSDFEAAKWAQKAASSKWGMK